MIWNIGSNLPIKAGISQDSTNQIRSRLIMQFGEVAIEKDFLQHGSAFG